MKRLGSSSLPLWLKLLVSAVAMLSLFPTTAFALAVPVVGWGYSIGNGIYSLVFPDQPSIKRGFGWTFDPPVDGLIVSGRLTAQFDPLWTVGGVGWFGEFGADPTLPAPPLGATEIDVALLQSSPNPLLQSASITIDQSQGRVVFDFDWGLDGFQPTVDHLNFAGIFFSNLTELPSNPLTIVGSPADVVANGKNALTYMSCRAPQPGSEEFFCGETVVPEPATPWLSDAGSPFCARASSACECAG